MFVTKLEQRSFYESLSIETRTHKVFFFPTSESFQEIKLDAERGLKHCTKLSQSFKLELVMFYNG